MFSPCRLFILLLVSALFLLLNKEARACPFCSAVAQTFAEEMKSMDVVVIAKLSKRSGGGSDEKKSDAELARGDSKSEFEIVDVIKGKEFVDEGFVFKTVFFGDAVAGDKFLVMGVEPPAVLWSTPLKMNDEGIKYVKKIPSLPDQGAKRLSFFQNYLEDKNEMLARDAYDEFAKAPYADVQELKPEMNHMQILDWIKNPDIPASRKRLYFTMLGVCGDKADSPLLEELMRSEDRLQKAGLDAMIACYLTLNGSDGLGLIEDLFLKNKSAEYSDTYAAISAIRFHGMETTDISQERLLAALRLMLDRPKLADLVIPDLARWKDWSAMDQLVQLFKDSTKETSWVRVPVINYLRACPLPAAKEHIKELEKIDPASVKRANTFFPLLDEEDEEEEDGEERDSEKQNEKEEAKKETGDSQSSSEIESGGVGAQVSFATNRSLLGFEQNQLISTFVETEVPAAQQNESADLPGEANSQAKDRVVTRRPMIDTEKGVSPASDVAIVEETNRVSDSSVMVAEIPFHHTLLIGGVPLLLCGLLFVFLWLVISGRVDRIGV